MEEVLEELRRSDDFLVLTHVDPDGDALGSQCALLLALRKMGKKAVAVINAPIPRRYRFLPYISQCQVASKFPSHRVCVTLDVGDLQRIRENARREEFARIVNIDHHVSNTMFGDVNWVDPRACAAGEMVWRILKALPVEPDRDILDSIYTAILSDTGRFQYSNTTPAVLRLGAELAEAGADIHGVSRKLFASESVGALRALRAGLANLRIHEGGRIGSVTLTWKELQDSGAAEDDTENLINFVRKVDTVEVALYLRERADGSLKLSLRSRNGVDVSRIAIAFGGGGHPYAAGAVMQGPMEEALEKALDACRKAIQGSEELGVKS